MNLPSPELTAKYIGTKSMMTINLFTQAMASAVIAYARYKDNLQAIDRNPALGVTIALADARFFCEAMGWCALLLRRLRHEAEVEGISELLTLHRDFIDKAYRMRIVINHSYNEDLADSYRTDNYREGLHKENFAFSFELDKDKSVNRFTLGTTIVDMDEYVNGLRHIESDLLALDVPRAGSYKAL